MLRPSAVASLAAFVPSSDGIGVKEVTAMLSRRIDHDQVEPEEELAFRPISQCPSGTGFFDSPTDIRQQIENKVTGASYPGSGSGWLRSLVEDSTELPTCVSNTDKLSGYCQSDVIGGAMCGFYYPDPKKNLTENLNCTDIGKFKSERYYFKTHFPAFGFQNVEAATNPLYGLDESLDAFKLLILVRHPVLLLSAVSEREIRWGNADHESVDFVDKEIDKLHCWHAFWSRVHDSNRQMPNMIKVVRYEDLCGDTLATRDGVIEFLGQKPKHENYDLPPRFKCRFDFPKEIPDQVEKAKQHLQDIGVDVNDMLTRLKPIMGYWNYTA